VAIGPGFDQRAQVPQPARRPELTGAFEPTLSLPTRRFHRSAAYRPSAAAPVGVPAPPHPAPRCAHGESARAVRFRCAPDAPETGRPRTRHPGPTFADAVAVGVWLAAPTPALAAARRGRQRHPRRRRRTDCVPTATAARAGGGGGEVLREAKIIASLPPPPKLGRGRLRTNRMSAVVRWWRFRGLNDADDFVPADAASPFENQIPSPFFLGVVDDLNRVAA
jgi:hypothetical protein